MRQLGLLIIFFICSIFRSDAQSGLCPKYVEALEKGKGFMCYDEPENAQHDSALIYFRAAQVAIRECQFSHGDTILQIVSVQGDPSEFLQMAFDSIIAQKGRFKELSIRERAFKTAIEDQLKALKVVNNKLRDTEKKLKIQQDSIRAKDKAVFEEKEKRLRAELKQDSTESAQQLQELNDQREDWYRKRLGEVLDAVADILGTNQLINLDGHFDYFDGLCGDCQNDRSAIGFELDQDQKDRYSDLQLRWTDRKSKQEEYLNKLLAGDDKKKEGKLSYLDAFRKYKEAQEYDFEKKATLKIDSIYRDLNDCLIYDCSEFESNADVHWMLAEVSFVDGDTLLAKERLRDALDESSNYTNGYSTNNSLKKAFKKLYNKDNLLEFEAFYSPAWFSDEFVISTGILLEPAGRKSFLKRGGGLGLTLRLNPSFRSGLNLLFQEYGTTYSDNNAAGSGDRIYYNINFFTQVLWNFYYKVSNLFAHPLDTRWSYELVAGAGPRLFLDTESEGDKVDNPLKVVFIWGVGLKTKYRISTKHSNHVFVEPKFERGFGPYNLRLKDVPNVTATYMTRSFSLRIGWSVNF